MKSSGFTFIPNHGVSISPCVPPVAIKALKEKWDHYNTEKNSDIMKYIWECISEFIPKQCNGQSLVGYNLDKTTLTLCKHKPKKEKEIFYKGGVSSITALVFLENKEDENVKFYDDKKNGIFFVSKNADFYSVNIYAGNAVFFTDKVSYEIKSPTYMLKIPIFYKAKYTASKQRKRVHFKKTFEIPTPNGEKFNKVQYVDNGAIFTLTPDIYTDKQTVKRWKEVESTPKPLQIQKRELSKHIKTTKGRPPTKEEDYCPNCYEILSLRLPINYNNCSGCLSPIVSIDERLLKK